MRELGQKIRALREAKGLTQTEVGEAVGVTHSAISKMERGRQEGTDYVLLKNLAQVLGEPVEGLEALLRDEVLPRPLTPTPELPREVPAYLVGSVSAGTGRSRVLDHWEYVPLSQTRGRLLRAAIVDGDCMAPEIGRGDTVIFDSNTVPRDGQVVVAVLLDEGGEGGAGVIKRFYKLPGKVKLQPNVGDPIIVAADQVRIEGVVIEVRKRYAA